MEGTNYWCMIILLQAKIHPPPMAQQTLVGLGLLTNQASRSLPPSPSPPLSLTHTHTHTR